MSWGRALSEKAVGGYRVRVLEPRPRHLIALLQHATRWGDRTFLAYGDRRIGYAAFVGASREAAARLRADGIAPGEVVLLQGANSPEWLVAFWGLVGAGAIVAQGNAWWSAEETATAVRLLGTRCVVADAKRRALVGPAARTLSLESFETCFDAAVDGGPPSPPDVDEEQPAVLIFTSGTTGRAKAATLSHRAVLACLHSLYLFRGRLPDEAGPADPQLVFFCCNPLFHVGGLLLQSQALLSGHRMVLLEGRATGEKMTTLIERERVNVWSTVPTLLSRVVDEAVRTQRTLPSLVSFSASGSPVSPELMTRARRVFPNARAGASTNYGMTESGGAVTFVGGDDYLAHPDSVGRALPCCELRIRDADAQGIGEILIRTPSAMSGYWGQPDASIVDRDGWIHTGDLGRLDAEGWLYVTGRSKDIIIRGGENVSSVAIEQRLLLHPAVAEVAVVGLPHPALGEQVGAVVVLRPGARTSPAELSAFAGESLAYFQVPEHWWLRDEALPTNAAGKVLKGHLQSEWRARCVSPA